MKKPNIIHYKKDYFKIGVISDTHGLLRNEALEALNKSDLILHAGDIGDIEIIEKLNEISPTISVKGNIDVSPAFNKLSSSEIIIIGGKTIFLVHKKTDFDSTNKNIDIVIFGHTHKPIIEEKGDILYLNPGSAGQKRFNLPISVALIEIKNGKLFPKIINLV